MKYLSLLIFLLLTTTVTFAQLPKASKGKVIRHENFASKYVDARHVDVWLPDNYSADQQYEVIYMHDGQNLYDETVASRNQEWTVDEILSNLREAGKLGNLIVVGIWNLQEKRHVEYFPQQVVQDFSSEAEAKLSAVASAEKIASFKLAVNSDNYLTFLVQELKPFIDKTYSTLPDRDHTYIAGSSMGGLISLYAMCEYPDVFGASACLSTHWPGVYDFPGNPLPTAFVNYFDKHLPSAKTHKVYFDYGSVGLDETYEPHQKMIDEVMKKHGYTQDLWITKSFPGHDHSALSWQKRLDGAFLFIMK